MRSWIANQDPISSAMPAKPMRIGMAMATMGMTLPPSDARSGTRTEPAMSRNPSIVLAPESLRVTDSRLPARACPEVSHRGYRCVDGALLGLGQRHAGPEDHALQGMCHAHSHGEARSRQTVERVVPDHREQQRRLEEHGRHDRGWIE